MNVLTDANGVCVLQTHDIDLAFTDSIFEICHVSFNPAAYWIRNLRAVQLSVCGLVP